MTIIVRRNDGGGALAPFYRPVGLFSEIDRLQSEVRDSWKPITVDHGLLSHADIYEEKDELVIKTELPGVNRENLDITLEGDGLTIKAEKNEEVNEDVTHHTRERHYGQYFRSVTLPYPVKDNKVSAIFDNGVLEIRLPKAEEAKAKRIEIKAQLPDGEHKGKQGKAKPESS